MIYALLNAMKWNFFGAIFSSLFFDSSKSHLLPSNYSVLCWYSVGKCVVVLKWSSAHRIQCVINKLRSHKKLNYADLKHKSHWTITQAALRPHFVNWTMANDVFFLNFYFLHSFCILIRTIKLKTDWRRLPSKLRLQSIYSIAFIILKSETKKSKRKNGSVTRRSCTII